MRVKSGIKSILLLLFILLLIPGCVTKGKYRSQVAENQTLSQELESEQERLAALESELEGDRGDAATAQKELSDRAAMLEQQLAVEKESKSKTEAQLREEMDRMKGQSEETNQKQQELIDSLKDELQKRNQAVATLQEQISGQGGEIGRLRSALQLTEEEAAQRERELREATRTREELIGKLEKEISEGNIKISQLKDRLSVEIVDKILFPSGSDQITGGGKDVLKKVSDILKNVKENSIRIEGHTDDVPIGSKLKDKFPSNWELSTSRATQVVRYLSDQGIDPGQLQAVGMAEYRPVAPNDTPEGKQRNRRIEIILFPKDIQEITASIR